MKTKRYLTLNLALVFLSLFGVFAQESSVSESSEEIKIVPIEHATAVLKWNDITIYIDPTGGKEAFEGFQKPDLILITDIHGDHFDLETLQELDTHKAKIMVPQAVAEKMPETFTPQIDVLDNGDEKERYGIKVEAIPMYNLREEALKFHQKGRGNGYVLNKNGKRIYISGDTEDIPEMRGLKDIDIALVCMNLPYTMPVESAADAVLEFKPKQVYPYHYRGRPDVSDVNKFKRLVNDGNPAIDVVQLDWYPNSGY
ncbi:MBL fold metallo-hydrolase [Allomuricauda sp. SCSIO 65647]|uniref:MBL fold metallo-hydrolase n=1 Tax=Allomuricauda sp. SCSIO 65647 TaxID=2908843 RepID=UPI001F489C36|nr:MBL fold metallo-hydrolase [Muricauda sp. SCSIO 65647]UJH67142.1 MBL fold metallo-hydrolase [Muricauda sp. SCSIO 65647]